MRVLPKGDVSQIADLRNFYSRPLSGARKYLRTVTVKGCGLFIFRGDTMYYVYILYSESGDRYYKGMSQNPENRLSYHNTKERGYTSRYRPWKLVWKRGYATKQEALSAEKQLKKRLNEW